MWWRDKQSTYDITPQDTIKAGRDITMTRDTATGAPVPSSHNRICDRFDGGLLTCLHLSQTHKTAAQRNPRMGFGHHMLQILNKCIYSEVRHSWNAERKANDGLKGPDFIAYEPPAAELEVFGSEQQTRSLSRTHILTTSRALKPFA